MQAGGFCKKYPSWLFNDPNIARLPWFGLLYILSTTPIRIRNYVSTQSVLTPGKVAHLSVPHSTNFLLSTCTSYLRVKETYAPYGTT